MTHNLRSTVMHRSLLYAHRGGNGFLKGKRLLQILRTVEEVRTVRHELYMKCKTVGFVPTMGALHSGHMKLMDRARGENDLTCASIFVNPTQVMLHIYLLFAILQHVMHTKILLQFSAGEDFDKYPRPLEKDIEMLEQAGIDLLFVPNKGIMYPSAPLCHVEPTAFRQISEGQARPEFFRGEWSMNLLLSA